MKALIGVQVPLIIHERLKCGKAPESSFMPVINRIISLFAYFPIEFNARWRSLIHSVFLRSQKLRELETTKAK